MRFVLIGVLVVLAIALLVTQWVRRAQLSEQRQATGTNVGRPSPAAVVLLVLIVVGIVVLAIIHR